MIALPKDVAKLCGETRKLKLPKCYSKSYYTFIDLIATRSGNVIYVS